MNSKNIDRVEIIVGEIQALDPDEIIAVPTDHRREDSLGGGLRTG